MLNRFKEARMRCGIAQKTVASKLGVSIQSVSNWENDSRAPSRENVMKMAEMYGVSTDYLLGKDVEGVQLVVETKKEPASIGELDDELVQNLKELNSEEIQFVRGVLAGLKARRAAQVSQKE